MTLPSMTCHSFKSLIESMFVVTVVLACFLNTVVFIRLFFEGDMHFAMHVDGQESKGVFFRISNKSSKMTSHFQICLA